MTFLCFLVAVPLGFAAPVSADVEVAIESGSRAGPDGTIVDYLLYRPSDSVEAPPPWPVVVLTHGFQRDFGRQVQPALNLARRGVVVMTPNLPNLLAGPPAQRRAIALLVDHVAWLVARNDDPEDVLFDRLDTDRIALAGHSAGGAVAFEAAWELQAGATPAAALVLLDAVPWRRTVARAPSLRPLPMISLRTAPSSCNAGSSGKKIVDSLPFATIDIFVVGASHCDPEGPTDIACSLVCGGSSAAARGVFLDLTGSFLADAFALPAAETLEETLGRLEDAGKIEIERLP